MGGSIRWWWMIPTGFEPLHRQLSLLGPFQPQPHRKAWLTTTDAVDRCATALFLEHEDNRIICSLQIQRRTSMAIKSTPNSNSWFQTYTITFRLLHPRRCNIGTFKPTAILDVQPFAEFSPVTVPVSPTAAIFLVHGLVCSS